MHSDVVKYQQISSGAFLNRKRGAKNVPSATMAEQQSPVVVHITGRMILVPILVLAYCFTSCLGVPDRPAVFPRALESDGSLEHISQIADDEAADYNGFAPSGVLYMGANMGANQGLDDEGKIFDQRKNRASSLKSLLENLMRLQRRKFTERSELDTEVTSQRNGEAKTGGAAITDGVGMNTLYPHIHYHHQSGVPVSPVVGTQPHDKSLQVVAHIDMILTPTRVGQTQFESSDHRLQTHKQSNTREVLPIADNLLTIEDNGVKYFDDAQDINIESTKQRFDKDEKLEHVDMERANPVGLHQFLNKEKYSTNYLLVPDNLVSSAIDSHSPDTRDFQYGGDNREINNYKSFNEETTFNDIPHESVVMATGKSSVVNDIQSSGSLGENAHQFSKPLSVDSLIHKTVKQMEDIIKKRVAHYNGAYSDDNSHNLHEDISMARRKFSTNNHIRNSGSMFVVTSQRNADSASFLVGKNAADNNGVDENEVNENSDKQFTEKQQQDDPSEDVIAAVSKAVASRTVPRDAQFWRNVSTYLDSSDYLSRTRRSPERNRKRNGGQFVHLSITYGHVMPCEHKDRFYCMNGGTCVFVGALDIKTCRCPIGYTGVRCEMIDQEYILSLLTNTLIFS